MVQRDWPDDWLQAKSTLSVVKDGADHIRRSLWIMVHHSVAGWTSLGLSRIPFNMIVRSLLFWSFFSVCEIIAPLLCVCAGRSVMVVVRV